MGQASAGPLVDVPIYTFTVPDIGEGVYVSYYTCPGSTQGWDALFEGADFTVTSELAATDLAPPRTSWPALLGRLLLVAGLGSLAVRLSGWKFGGHHDG
jgi:hypothetical protein